MRIAAVLLAASFSTGCMAVYSPAIGVLFTELHGPLDAGTKVGAEEGRACVQAILGLIATGDASIKAAARDGNITQIASVDHYTRNILGILGEFCTIVRGS